jgi:hypothetical protein
LAEARLKPMGFLLSNLQHPLTWRTQKRTLSRGSKMCKQVMDKGRSSVTVSTK